MAHLIPDSIRSQQGVPSTHRRVATALKLGLDDGAIVWYEPLFDADGTKPHFIVLLPDNGLAVIEVLDVRASKLLGVVRGKLRIELDGEEVEADQPLVRAEVYAETLRARIAAEPRLADVQLPVASAALFPSLEQQDALERGLAATGLDVGRCLFRSEVDAARGADGAALDRWFARVLGAGTPIEGPLVDVVRGLVQPDLVIDRPEDDGQLAIFRPPEGDELVRVMDQQQEVLAKSIGHGHRVIRGVAGSGKTLILVYRARLLAEMHPDQRFLLACYNRSLASELEALLTDYENVEVAPVHVLIGRAIRAAGLDDPGFADDSGEERAAAGVEALDRGALPRYRAVLLDEAQDLGPNALRFVVALADQRFDDVLVVADAAQNVYRRSFTWKAAGIQAQGRRTRVLRRNYRNTREILELAHRFLVPQGVDEASLDLDDEAVIVPPEAALRSGPLPTVVIGETEELIDLAFRELANASEEDSPPKSIGALTIGGWQAIELERRLRAARIEHYFVTDPQEKWKRDKVAEADSQVILSTVYSAKGLEFPTVILCCTPRGTQDLEELRRTIYVGMTRATERLFVFADEKHPLVDDLRAAAASSGRLVVEIDD
ncbi:MAG: AAA family ATPase [Gaiella sp.]|nr:AAA family ATPase [Gaiella sp.]